MSRLLSAALYLILLSSPALAGSTINPAQPAANSALASAPVRQNFNAAYNDVNSILGMFASPNPPGSPTNFQRWADTTSTSVVFKYYNSRTVTWVPFGTLNTLTGVFTPYQTSAGITATSPLSVSVVSGVANISLSGVVGLSHGGTNTVLAPSNGGVVYSTSTALAVLAGTITANQALLSGASGAPSWSTATYPATVSANQVLATGSSANIIAGTSTLPNAVQDNITRLGIITSLPSINTSVNIGVADNNNAIRLINSSLSGTIGWAATMNQVGSNTSIVWNEYATGPTVTGRARWCPGGLFGFGDNVCPTTTLESHGSFGTLAHATVTTDYTVGASDSYVPCDATAGYVAVTLPNPASFPGRILNIEKIDTTQNGCGIVGTIRGVSVSQFVMYSPTQSRELKAVGAAWSFQ